jgi:hypothetical protein
MIFHRKKKPKNDKNEMRIIFQSLRMDRPRIMQALSTMALQFRHYRGLRWEVGARFEIPRAIAVLSRTIGHDAGRFYGIRPI